MERHQREQGNGPGWRKTLEAQDAKWVTSGLTSALPVAWQDQGHKLRCGSPPLPEPPAWAKEHPQCTVGLSYPETPRNSNESPS